MENTKPAMRPWIALLLGFIGVATSFFSYSFEIQDTKVSLLIAPLFPLLAAYAWGLQGAIYASLPTLWFAYPFWLWPTNGFANIASSLFALLWIGIHSIMADSRRFNPKWWKHPILVQFWIFPLNYLLLVITYKWLLALNPAPWADNSVTSIRSSVLDLIFLKNISNSLFLVALANALLSIPHLRRWLNLPDGGKAAKYNLWIFCASLSIGIILATIISIIQQVSDGSGLSLELLTTPDPQNVVIGLLVISASIFIGGASARFVEKHLKIEEEIQNKLQQKHQELQFKNEDLEALLYMVSHDVRSPLVNIRGFVMELKTLLQNPEQIKANTPPYHEVLQTIQFIDTSTQRLSAIASGALRIARLGKGNIHFEFLNPNEIVGEVLHTLKFQIQESGAHIAVENLPNCFGDRNLFSQIVMNLIDNALKYRNPGAPAQIEITGAINGQWSTYTVRDHGIAIPEYQHGKVFEPLFRIDRNSKVTGQGLGLAIVRRVLSIQSGKIWIESTPQAIGNRFCFTLPANKN